jgi:uncharacterized SAM-binding protein YcdF (DUF218 family)
VTYTKPLLLLFSALALIGLIRLRDCKGFLLSKLALLALLLISWPPVDWLLSRPLEARYPVRPLQPAAAQAPVQAIVVLSSAVEPPVYERPYAIPDKQTYERCEFAAWLYHHWRPVPVLACGGRGQKNKEPLSLTMRHLLERAGVPENMIWTEESSRSTHENALYGAGILRKQGIGTIALVVEAQSMVRAEACFRKQGITVVPAPNSFREFGSLQEELIPSAEAISRNEGTLHEFAGLAWYWLRGWI